jgi:hypothetical protein
MISGRQRKELREALVDAFPTVDAFKMVVADALDTYLSEISRTHVPLEVMVFDAIEFAERCGRLSELVLGALSANSLNPRLRAVAQRFEFPEALAGELERFTRSMVSSPSPEHWLNQVRRLQRAVCRIEPQSATVSLNGYATGFLVSSDIVMTCDYVVEEFWGDEPKAAAVRFRFDLHNETSGMDNPGVEYSLHPTAWRVFKSDDRAIPVALVRLAEWAGDGGLRCGLTAAERRPNPFEPIILFHHGTAGPLKLAFGAVVPDSAPDVGNTSIAYKVNTEPGSGGAPCFNSELKVAAIHHSLSTSVSYGIEISAVRDHLWQRAGIGLFV